MKIFTNRYFDEYTLELILKEPYKQECDKLTSGILAYYYSRFSKPTPTVLKFNQLSSNLLAEILEDQQNSHEKIKTNFNRDNLIDKLDSSKDILLQYNKIYQIIRTINYEDIFKEMTFAISSCGRALLDLGRTNYSREQEKFISQSDAIVNLGKSLSDIMLSSANMIGMIQNINIEQLNLIENQVVYSSIFESAKTRMISLNRNVREKMPGVYDDIS